MEKHTKRKKKIIILMCLLGLIILACILILSFILPELLAKHVSQFQLGDIVVNVMPPKVGITGILVICYCVISITGIGLLAPDIEALLWVRERKKALIKKR